MDVARRNNPESMEAILMSVETQNALATEIGEAQALIDIGDLEAAQRALDSVREQLGHY